MIDLVNKTKITNTHVTLRDHTLRQNRWVSSDFKKSLDLSQVTKALSHMKCGQTFQWEKFQRRAQKKMDGDETVRIACGPIFKPSNQTLRYDIEGNKPVPTHFFGIIAKEGEIESYILPNKELKSECSLKKFKTTTEKVELLAGLILSDSATSLSQTPDPKACARLKKKHFTILSNPRTRQPYYTIHKISQNSLKGKVKRSHFRKENDPVLPNRFRVTNNDYKKTGMHKGHMMPAEDCKASTTKMKESFALSNAAPQYPNFNKSTWRRLETHTHKVVSDLEDPDEEATVISGPLFIPTAKRGKTRIVKRPLMGDSEVPIASHFFKVIHTSKGTEAYILRHNNRKFKGKSAKLIKSAKVNPKELERLSGINLTALLS